MMTVCRKNLYYAQDLQKQTHDKNVEAKSYVPSNKIWLNSKYIKTKQKRKLDVNFFGPIQVLPPLDKQAYKLKLPKKWRIHHVFHV